MGVRPTNGHAARATSTGCRVPRMSTTSREDRAMSEQTFVREVSGPWSLAISRAFWEGFTPAALHDQAGDVLRTVFVAERDWTTVTATVRQEGSAAHITVAGSGDLDAAAGQVARFLALDIDARGWPAVGDR